MNARNWRDLAVTLACVSLAACNGSNSSGSSSGNTPPTPYTVGGAVTGLAGSGLVLQDSAGDTVAVSADGSFTFTRQLAGGSNFYISVVSQPTNPAQTCQVSGGSGVLTAANATSATVTCTTKTTQTDTLGGLVTGLLGSGLVLQDTQGDTLKVAGDGPFVFPTPLTAGTAYTVSVLTPPVSPNQDCSISNPSGTAGATDITGIIVSCATNTNPTEPVSATVTGVNGTGVTVQLQDNGRDTLQVTADGTYSFATPVPAGSPYSVTAQVSGGTTSLTCTVTAGSGVVQQGTAVVVAVQCAVNAPVAITTSGLAGSGLVLQDNLGDPSFQITSNGTTTFASSIAPGQQYQLSVSAQPTQPWQTCVISSGGTGTAGSQPGALISASLSCTTHTHTVSGVVSGLPNPVPGSTLTLVDNGSDKITVTGNGAFHFPTSVTSGAAYAVAVTVQPGNDTSYGSGYTQTDVVCAVTANGGGVIADTDITNVTVQCANQPLGIIYVANSGDNTLSSYLVDASGSLVPSGAPVATGTTPASVAALSYSYLQTTSPQPASFVYAANLAANSLSVYTTDPETGIPTAAGSALSLGLNRPSVLTLDSNNGYLYAANQGPGPGSVSAFSLATPTAPAAVANDASQPLGTLPVGAVSEFTPCAFDSNFNNDFYFLNSTDNTISGLVQDATGGGVTPISTTQVGPTPGTATSIGEIFINQGTFVYATYTANATSQVAQFSVSCNVDSTFPVGALLSLGAPVALAGPPQGSVSVGENFNGPWYFYVSINSGIEGFSVATGGTLTALSAPNVFPAGTTPASMTTADFNLTTTGDTTTGSTQVTLAAANPAILPGMLISGGGMPNGAIVSAVNGTTLTLSAPAVSTGTGQFLQVSTSYVYVTNTGDNTISVFRVNFTTGVLVPLGAPVPCGTNPAAIFFVPRPSFVSG